MKVLNIDSLVKVEMSVTVNGVEHPVQEMDVETFIKANEESERLKDMGVLGIREELDATIKHINMVIPTLGEAELRKLKIVQLMAIVQFINGTLADEKEAGAEIAEASGN
jgi:hypothetical protein